MILLLMGAAFISFAAVFVTTAAVGPDVSGFYRMVFGGLSLLVYLTVTGGLKQLDRLLLKKCLLLGILLFLDFFCWHRTILALGPGPATLFGNFQAIFSALAAVLVLGERMRSSLAIALGLALGGVYLIVGVDWNSLPGDVKTGVFWGVATGLVYSAYILVLRHMVTGLKSGVAPVVTCVTLVTAVYFGGWMLATGQSFALPSTESLLSLVALGVLCQFIGWLMISKGLPMVRASVAGLFLLLQPVLAYVWDVLFFARPVSMLEITGACLALVGVYLGSLSGSKKA